MEKPFDVVGVLTKYGFKLNDGKRKNVKNVVITCSDGGRVDLSESKTLQNQLERLGFSFDESDNKKEEGPSEFAFPYKCRGCVQLIEEQITTMKELNEQIDSLFVD